MHVNDNGGCGGVGGGGGGGGWRHTLFLDSMVRVNTACDLLLSRFIEVDATRRFNQPVVNTWGEGRGMVVPSSSSIAPDGTVRVCLWGRGYLVSISGRGHVVLRQSVHIDTMLYVLTQIWTTESRIQVIALYN